MAKTIQKMADAYVGHPQEADEDLTITALRDGYRQGASDVVNIILGVFIIDSKASINDRYWNIFSKIKELLGI